MANPNMQINTKIYGRWWEYIENSLGRIIYPFEKKKEDILSIYGTPRDFIEDVFGRLKYSVKENKGILAEFVVGTAKTIVASELERTTGRNPLSVYLASSGLADIVHGGAIRPNKKLPRNNEFTIVEMEALRYVGMHLENIIYKIKDKRKTLINNH